MLVIRYLREHLRDRWHLRQQPRHCAEQASVSDDEPCDIAGPQHGGTRPSSAISRSPYLSAALSCILLCRQMADRT